MNETFQEFKKRIRDAEKQPLPEGFYVMCACGKHTERTILTDEQIEDLWRIIHDGV